MPNAEVQLYDPPFRGYAAFQKYSPAQLVALKELLIYLCDKFNIPKTYHPTMWDVSKDAIGGAKGIWTHTSYRLPKDKQDCHPQPELIAMLKGLDGLSV